jgi:outer membrane protein assembly factor BamB
MMKRGRLRDNQMLQRFVLVVFFIGTCVGVAGSDSAPKDSAETMLVSPSLLKHAGLEAGWQINLPLKDRETVSRMFIFDKYLYVLTNRNYLFCIDRVGGSIRFCLELARAGLKIHQPQYYEGKLMFTVGTGLLILDPAAGAITESKQLKNIGRGAVCGARRNSRHIFLAGLDKRLHAIVVDEYWKEFAITADNDSLINSIVVNDEFVVFSTVPGNVVMTSAQKAQRLWQRDIPGTISAPIARDGDWLYVGSDNTKLYKLEIQSGRSGWDAPFQAGARLTDSVTVGRKAVYQYAGDNGLYAVDKESGQMLWQVTGGTGLIAEKDETAYVLAGPGVLVVMNNDTGKELYSVNFAGVSRYAANTTDSTIYVSDDNGRVMSINVR